MARKKPKRKPSKPACPQCGGELELFPVAGRRVCRNCHMALPQEPSNEVLAHSRRLAKELFGLYQHLPREGQVIFCGLLMNDIESEVNMHLKGSLHAFMEAQRERVKAQENLDNVKAELKRRTPQVRYPERRAEVIRLHEAGLKPRQIAAEIRNNENWMHTESGSLFTARNVKSILQQVRNAGRVAQE